MIKATGKLLKQELYEGLGIIYGAENGAQDHAHLNKCHLARARLLSIFFLKSSTRVGF